MNLEQLIQQYRVSAHDTAQPYFADDERLTSLFNEAVHEAAIRGRLIHESQRVDICEVAVVPNQAVYPLHSSLYEITHSRWLSDTAGDSVPVKLVSTETLDSVMPEWRERSGQPECAIQDDMTIRLVPRPHESGTLYLEGYRVPLADMVNLGDEPEINSVHHRHLYHWVMKRVFTTTDAEVFDPQRADEADAEFTRYFGLRPDSDLRRIVREDEPHHIQPFFV